MMNFLEEMISSDPDEYSRLIRESKNHSNTIPKKASRNQDSSNLFIPIPGFCVATRKINKNEYGRIFFVNFCHAAEVPGVQFKPNIGSGNAPDDEPLSNVLIPLSVGVIREEKNQSQEYSICDVVINSRCMKRAKKDRSFKMFIVELGLQNIETDHSEQLHRAINFTNEKYKGFEKPPPQMTEKGLREQQKKMKPVSARKKSKNPDIILPFGKAAAYIKELDDALQEGANARTKKSLLKKKKKRMIEEIPSPLDSSPPSNSTQIISRTSKSTQMSIATPIHRNMELPRYRIIYKKLLIIINIELPKVSSVNDLILDISIIILRLSSPFYELLQLRFTRLIDQNKATAKFNKTKRRLTVKAPFRQK